MLLDDGIILRRFVSVIRELVHRKMSENTKKNIVAICHMRTTNKKDDNLRQVQDIIEKAKQQSATFVFLPECCDFVGENRKQTLELSEPLTGPTVQAYKDLAKCNKLWLSLGGIHEAILGTDGVKTNKIHNTHLVINDSGNIVAAYRKLHLFDVDTPEFRFRESDVVTSGSNIVAPIDTPIGCLGLQICYDVRFPEASTILRKKGAEILTYPSAFAYSTGKAHWEILLRARAIENQCYVIAPAQIGFHNEKRQSYGHGMIIGPWGQIVAQCKEEDNAVAVGEIDLNSVENVRKSMPCFEHRRNEVYTLAPIEIKSDKSCDTYKFGQHTIPLDTVFYASEHSFAFTNIRCVVPGHVLVATKRSTTRLKDMTNDEITDFFQTVCKVQKCTEKLYETTSSTVTVQDGEDAGQTVRHVHCHVMPRKKGDFEHNDQIYIELNRHDHEETQPRRSISDMIAEAKMYLEIIHLD